MSRMSGPDQARAEDTEAAVADDDKADDAEAAEADANDDDADAGADAVADDGEADDAEAAEGNADDDDADADADADAGTAPTGPCAVGTLARSLPTLPRPEGAPPLLPGATRSSGSSSDGHTTRPSTSSGGMERSPSLPSNSSSHAKRSGRSGRGQRPMDSGFECDRRLKMARFGSTPPLARSSIAARALRLVKLFVLMSGPGGGAHGSKKTRSARSPPSSEHP